MVGRRDSNPDHWNHNPGCLPLHYHPRNSAGIEPAASYADLQVPFIDGLEPSLYPRSQPSTRANCNNHSHDCNALLSVSIALYFDNSLKVGVFPSTINLNDNWKKPEISSS